METKRCTKCHEEFPATGEFFHKGGRKKYPFRAWCKSCANIWRKTYYEANKEAITARTNKANHNIDKNKQKIRYRTNASLKRARKIQATPPWLTKEHRKQIKILHAIADTLTEQTGIKRHVDHIIPLQGKNVCGLHVPWNLRIITAEENLKKSNKLLSQENLNCLL